MSNLLKLIKPKTPESKTTRNKMKRSSQNPPHSCKHKIPEAIKLYDGGKGLTYREISESLGVSIGTLSYWFKKLNVERRVKNVRYGEEWSGWMDLKEKGETVAQIAKGTDACEKTIFNTLHKHA